MRLIVIDETDKILVEYDKEQIRVLLVKYFEILKDIGKAFDQICEDLLDKARTK